MHSYLLTLASNNGADAQETMDFFNGLQIPGRAVILDMQIILTYNHFLKLVTCINNIWIYTYVANITLGLIHCSQQLLLE